MLLHFYTSIHSYSLLYFYTLTLFIILYLYTFITLLSYFPSGFVESECKFWKLSKVEVT